MPDYQDFQTFFQTVPKWIDLDAIWKEWQALQSHYRVEDRCLPAPLWGRRGLTEDGVHAWHTLSNELTQIHPTKPFCIYIHIPFCTRKCSFCDCYSFRLSRNREKHVDEYCALLENEMAQWGQLGTLNQRPVSTIHLGGGTPTFFSEAGLTRIVNTFNACFQIQPDTELALESTTSELTGRTIESLTHMGFSRLHLGVQSLDDQVRQFIGRREPGSMVLEKISRAVDFGWIVSVDLIIGLPAQTLDGVLSDIRTLKKSGVEGFSLYELQASHRNRKFIQHHNLVEGTRLQRYFLLQAASQQLKELGYKKTLFNHFALEKDTNLYFTFPQRQEDCLALGTIADGIFNDFHYRHMEYNDYRKFENGQFLGLQGGIRRNNLENLLYPLEVALLSGTISPRLFTSILGDQYTNTLLNRWKEASLIYAQGEGKSLGLTTNGSWLVARMLEETRDLAAQPLG